MALILGIAGRKGAGKSTASKALEKAGFYRDSFAAPLRKFVADICGYSLEQLDKNKQTPIMWLDGLTPREMMQQFGTECGRGLHPELWLLSLSMRLPQDRPVVIEDVRFPNEAEWIRDQGGYVIEIERPGLEWDGDTHASETPIPPELINSTLTNQGSVLLLEIAICAAVKPLLGNSEVRDVRTDRKN